MALQTGWTKTQRIARTTLGEKGVFIQGPDIPRFLFPGYILAGDEGALAQIENLEDEVNRPYFVTMQDDEWIRPNNPTGRYYTSLDGVTQTIPGSGGRTDPLSGRDIYMQYQVSGLGFPWASYRRCRYFKNIPVTPNTFGLPGVYEIPMPPLDGALSFNGSTQYTTLDAGVSADLDLTGKMDIRASIYHDTSVGTDTIFTKNSGANDYNFCVSISADDAVVFNYTSAGPVQQVYSTGNGVVSLLAKHRIGVQFEPNATMKIYVDGILQSGSWTAGNGVPVPLVTADKLRIGADGAASNYFAGDVFGVSIDSPASFDSAANMLLDYRLGCSVLTSTMKGLWQLNEWVGTANYDSAGLNDLTMTNTPTFTGGYLAGTTPSETVDYFKRTSIGVIPVAYAPDMALSCFEAHDYFVDADAINVTKTLRDCRIDDGLLGFKTNVENASYRGRMDLVYWDKSAWNLSHLAAFYGEVASASGALESFTDTGPPSVDVESGPYHARMSLTYPSTASGYSVTVIHTLRRHSGIVKTEVFNAGPNLARCRIKLNLTGTTFTKRTQLGATGDAGSNSPVAMTLLAGSSSSTDATTYTTASISPSSRKLILAVIMTTKATLPDVPTLAGCGLTWVQVATALFNNIATPLNRITVFRAMSTGATPTPGTLVFSFGGATQTGGNWSVSEFDHVDLTGTNGSGAVVQSVTNNANAATSLTVTLAAFGNAANATFGVHGIDANNTFNVEAGYTEISDAGTATPVSDMQVEWKNSNDTSVTADNGAASVDWGGIALEIKAGETIADSDSNNFNYVHTADPWATTAVAAGFIRAKKVDANYLADDVGAYWSSVGLEFCNVTIEENQAFPAFYWFIGRYDCINRTVAQLASLALREITVADDIDPVA